MKIKSPQAKMIEQGYNEGPMMFRLYFIRQELSTLKECMDVVREYNEFRSRTAFRALEKLNEAGLLFSVEFGREYSPVLYVGLQGGRMVGDTWQEFTPGENVANARAAKKAFSHTRYDEMSITYNERGVANVRVWWD